MKLWAPAFAGERRGRCQVDFYQLGRDPLAVVLARIATRVLAGGGRMLVVTGDEAQAAALDEATVDRIARCFSAARSRRVTTSRS